MKIAIKEVKTMELGKNYKKAIEIAENEGWDVSYGNIPDESYTFTFHQYTNAGGDFDFEVCIREDNIADDNIYALLNAIYDYWLDYDVDETVYLYLDHTGHPCNGAPNSISALAHDVEEWISWVRQLYEKLVLNF